MGAAELVGPVHELRAGQQHRVALVEPPDDVALGADDRRRDATSRARPPDVLNRACQGRRVAGLPGKGQLEVPGAGPHRPDARDLVEDARELANAGRRLYEQDQEQLAPRVERPKVRAVAVLLGCQSPVPGGGEGPAAATSLPVVSVPPLGGGRVRVPACRDGGPRVLDTLHLGDHDAVDPGVEDLFDDPLVAFPAVGGDAHERHHVGAQARLMSQALRKLTANIKRSNTLVIFINQIRMKIGVMFGNPETTTGGNALKFYASVRLDIRRIGAIKKGDEVIGSETRVKVVKNKVAPPFRQADFDILYGEGISREGEVVDLGVLHKVIEKSGAWYSYGSDRIGQGKDNAREFLKEHKDMAAEVEAKIRASAGVAAGAVALAEEEE